MNKYSLFIFSMIALASCSINQQESSTSTSGTTSVTGSTGSFGNILIAEQPQGVSAQFIGDEVSEKYAKSPNQLEFRIRVFGNSRDNKFRSYKYGPTLAYWINEIQIHSKNKEHDLRNYGEAKVIFKKGTGRGNGDYGFAETEIANSIRSGYFNLGKYGVVEYDPAKERSVEYFYLTYGEENSFGPKATFRMTIPKGLDTSKVHLFTLYIKNGDTHDLNVSVGYDGYEGQSIPPTVTYENMMYKVRVDIDYMTNTAGEPLFLLDGKNAFAGRKVVADVINILGHRQQKRSTFSTDGYDLKSWYTPVISKAYDPATPKNNRIAGSVDISAENDIIIHQIPGTGSATYEAFPTHITNLTFDLELPQTFTIAPERVHLFTITYRKWSDKPSLHYDGIE